MESVRSARVHLVTDTSAELSGYFSGYLRYPHVLLQEEKDYDEFDEDTPIRDVLSPLKKQQRKPRETAGVKLKPSRRRRKHPVRLLDLKQKTSLPPSGRMRRFCDNCTAQMDLDYAFEIVQDWIDR